MKKFLFVFFIIPLISKAQSDTPCGAVFLTVHNDTCGFITGTTVGALYQNNLANGGTPPCASPGAADVWYAFVVPASGAVAVTTEAGTITDGGMAIFSGTCNNLQYIECDDDDCVNMMPVIDRSDYTPGDTLYVRFWKAWGAGTGTFRICAVESHSDCRRAIPLCNEFRYNGNPYGAGSNYDAAGTHCDITEFQSVWFHFRFQTSGTFKFTIVPDSIFWGFYPDWDWLIYKDTVAIFCNAFSISYPTICCNGSSSMGPNGETGLDLSGTSASVPAGPGNPYCPVMNVTAGEEYYMLINNFTISATGFDIMLGGTAQLDCGLIMAAGNEIMNFDRPLVYPNPGRGLFTFTKLESGSSVAIYDYTGRAVLLGQASNESFAADLRNYRAGIFLYAIKTPSGQEFRGKLCKE